MAERDRDERAGGNDGDIVDSPPAPSDRVSGAGTTAGEAGGNTTGMGSSTGPMNVLDADDLAHATRSHVGPGTQEENHGPTPGADLPGGDVAETKGGVVDSRGQVNEALDAAEGDESETAGTRG